MTGPPSGDDDPQSLAVRPKKELCKLCPQWLGVRRQGLLEIAWHPEVDMPSTVHRKFTVDTEHFSILNVTPPFVDICLQLAYVYRREFPRIAEVAAGYPNDARLIEMVRFAGDASGKVPYVLNAGETKDSILALLREAAGEQLAYFQGMPDALQYTICQLLSINQVPRGCEAYALTALLEIDWMQEKMIHTLQEWMSKRPLAQEFHDRNVAALEELDRNWPRLRSEKDIQWHTQPLPEHPKMEYHPLFDHKDRLVSVRETCVIVEPPGAHLLKRLTPPVLQRPLPSLDLVPSPRSVDWFIRDSGKIGRHFTRALIEIIKTHLKTEKVVLAAGNYERINRGAQDALEDFVCKTP
jgi:hypothetical protein